MLLVISVTMIIYSGAPATFNFSTASLAISEGGDLSPVLFINKTGDNEMTITLQVIVINGTANQNEG